MSKFPKRTPFSLQQRLRSFIDCSVVITAERLALEPSKLTRVLKADFIIVQNERFVPLSANYIQVTPFPRAKNIFKAGVRTTFDAEGLFDDVELIRIGLNFIELQRPGEENGRYLIPLNKVVGLFGI